MEYIVHAKDSAERNERYQRGKQNAHKPIDFTNISFFKVRFADKLSTYCCSHTHTWNFALLSPSILFFLPFVAIEGHSRRFFSFFPPLSKCESEAHQTFEKNKRFTKLHYYYHSRAIFQHIWFFIYKHCEANKSEREQEAFETPTFVQDSLRSPLTFFCFLSIGDTEQKNQRFIIISSFNTTHRKSLKPLSKKDEEEETRLCSRHALIYHNWAFQRLPVELRRKSKHTAKQKTTNWTRHHQKDNTPRFSTPGLLWQKKKSTYFVRYLFPQFPLN